MADPISCARCGVLIDPGTPHVVYVRHVERRGRLRAITVLDAKTIGTVCTDCGDHVQLAVVEKQVEPKVADWWAPTPVLTDEQRAWVRAHLYGPNPGGHRG